MCIRDRKDHIEKAPAWCSVDLRDGNQALIEPMSCAFCADCTRIRITADGKLKPCLHSDAELALRGLSGAELRCAVGESVEKCRLHDVLHEELEALSKGFKRRVCLAQAIMHHPENLVLDEPTDGLDPDQKREIRTLIREIRLESAVIVSTHILEEVDAVCDNVLAIRNGHKVFYGTTCEFRALDPDDGSLELLFDRLPEGFTDRVSGFRLLAVEPAGEGTLVRVMPDGVNHAELILSLIHISEPTRPY